MKGIAIACFLAALTQGCSSRDETPLPLAVTRAFEETFASDDAAAMAALFTEDAEILTQERPTVRGRHNIQQYFAEQMSPAMMFDETTDMSLVRGDFALETGSYTFRNTRRGDDAENGKYMHVWRRSDDHWKLYRAMYNTDEPTKAEVSVTYLDE